MELISKYNKGIRCLLCAIDLFSKYAFVVPFKDKKGTTIVNAFQSILDSSQRKPEKIWVDQGSEFYKFKLSDYVRISKCKNIFTKGYAPNWSEEIFVVTKIKKSVPWTYVISDLNGEEVLGSFYEKELPKTNQKEFRIKKVIKRKRNKLYVKWKGYDNSFNTWIDKKDLIK